MTTQRHKHEVVVHMVLLADQQVYLLQRAPGKNFGGLYALPGGFLEPGENLHDAAVRECQEETGCVVAQARLAALMSYRSRGDASQQGLNAVFVADTFANTPEICEPDNFSDGGFFPVSKLPDRCVPWLEDALTAALDQINGQDTHRAQLFEYVWD